MLGLLQSMPRAASLAIVYTPAAHRRRGYARAGAARLSARLAERGVAKRYFHFDPANRAAQGLAQKLGGELVQAGSPLLATWSTMPFVPAGSIAVVLVAL